MEKNKVFSMPFGKVYGCLVAKAERKGHTRQEVDALTCWLTGYTADEIREQVENNADYGTFFEEAPAYNVHAENIKGSICGVKIQEIEDPLMKRIRQLDKLVDELARGKSVEKILAKLEDK